MNLAIKAQPTQPKTNWRSLVEQAASHLREAARITDVDDLRHFTMRDLQEVRINLHLALELLSVIRETQ